MPSLFDMNMGFLGEILSLEGFVSIGVAIIAVVIVYLVSARYASSAMKIAAKTLPVFGFSESEVGMFSEMASGLVKTAGIATILVIVGMYVPLLKPIYQAGSFILTILGYAVTLALPLAVVYLARNGFNK